MTTTLKSEEERALGYLPLTESTFAILASLGNPLHGYGIMVKVAEVTGGEIRLGPGTLYGALTKLLKEGLLEKAGEENGGERKKLYLLTPLGRRVVALESERLERLSRWGRELLSREG